MGFSTAGATAIVFVGLLLSLNAAYPAVEASHERITDAEDRLADRSLERRNGGIDVADATYNATTDVLEVTATNTGSTTFALAETDLLVDGAYRTWDGIAVDGESGRTLWHAGEQATFTVDGVSARPGRVKLVSEFGLADVEVGI